MALVLPFRPPSAPRGDLISFYERMLERSKKGEVQGVICIVSIANAEDEIALSGEFAENLAYAASAARVGLKCLVGHKADDENETVTPSLRARQLAGG